MTMLSIKCFCIIVWMVFFLQQSHTVSAQRLTIQPSTVSVGGMPSAPTTTPEVVVMECNPDGLPIDTIYAMYIKRNSVSFAEIIINKVAMLSTGAPIDIVSKMPTVEGSITGGNIYSSVLKVTFLASRMSCQDEATYQCHVNYKPQNSDSADASTSTSLNVNVLPRDLQISAAMANDFNLIPIQNLTIVDAGEQVEFSCTGYVGDSQTTVIEWHRKTLPNMFFQRFYPSQAGDSIDDGFPSSSSCEYTRTSKLRFTMTTIDTTISAFRCEVASGTQYRAYSQEFHLTPGFNPTNGMATLLTRNVCVARWAMSVLICILVW